MTETLVRPAFLSMPDRVGSFGDDAIELAERCGRVLDGEERLAVDAMLSYGRGDRWVALESAVIEARQNGKTGGILLPVVLYDLFFGPSDRIVWTAHLFRTARDAFMDFVGLIKSTPELDRMVNRFTYANGEEAIELVGGAKLEFLARSKGGGRGLGGKRLIMDEALFLSAESMGALIPTLSARPDPQINYGSSAGLGTSDHLRALRDRGRRGDDPSLVWVEWCAPGGWDDPPCDKGIKCTHLPDIGGCALDDESLWPLANPTIGQRITYEYVRAERRALPPAEFGRERLGWWDLDDGTAAAFGVGKWEACASEDRPEGLKVGALAVAVSFDLTHAAVGAAALHEDVMHLKPLEHGPGTSWVVARVKALQAEHGVDVVVGGRGPAAVLIPDLEAAGVRLRVAETADWLDACAGLFDLVHDGKARHGSLPELNSAVAGAVKRSVGDRWAWGRKQSGSDISTLEGVTLAAWLAGQRPTDYDVLDSVR